MTLQGGSLDMDQNEETAFTAIDIFDSNEKLRSIEKEGDTYYTKPGYLRGGKLNSFYRDDISIVACGHSNNDDYISQSSDTQTVPIISLFRGEMFDLMWTKQYKKSASIPSSSLEIDVSGITQCFFSPSGSFIVAQFSSNMVSDQQRTYRDMAIIAIINSQDGSIMRALNPRISIQERNIIQIGYGKEFELSMQSDTQLISIFRLNQAVSSLVMFRINPMLSEQQINIDVNYTATRIIAYQTAPNSISMAPVHLDPYVQFLSPDKKNLYVGGGIIFMTSLFRWSVSSNKVDWLFLSQNITYQAPPPGPPQSGPPPPGSTIPPMNIIQIASGLNQSQDVHQIVYCARADVGIEKRNLIGYIIEKSYSKGGEPKLQKSIMIDPETRGLCQDVFVDMLYQTVSIFIFQNAMPPNQPGRSLILTIPLSISQNMTASAFKIGQSQVPILYSMQILQDHAVKLTGLQRAIFAGKTLIWEGNQAQMSFLSTFPTSNKLTNDPLTVDVYLQLNPILYAQNNKSTVELFKLVPNPIQIQFADAYIQQAQIQNNNDGDSESSPPYVGLPSIRLTYSMEGQLYYKYTVGGDPLLIGLKFQEIGPCTDMLLNYTIDITPETPSDSVITYDGAKIRIYTSQQFDVGGYQIQVTATTPNRVNKTAEFFVRIYEMKINDMISTAQAAPYFASDLERMINVTYQCTKIYQLPQIKDTNPVGQVKINFVSSTTRVGLPNFIVYQQNKLIIKPTQTIEIAIHTITIILTNQNKQTQNYTLYVQVLPYDSQVMQSITIDTSKRKDFMIQSKRENFPKAKMVKVNQRGEVTVKLDRRGSSKDLQIKEDNFLFQVDPPQRLQWKIKQDRQTESLMIIQLEFENSQSISISAMKRSKLQMFFKPSIGIRRLESILCGRSLQTQQSDPLLFYQDDVDIPVQLESDKIMTFFNNLGKTFKSIATSILASNLSVTMIMSCSMQLLWSFINSMQLISLIPLMTLNIPSNMYYLCSLISGPLAFQLIDVSNITKSLFSLQQYYEPYNQQFGQFGFQNTMLIVELQASLYILLLTPGIFALIFCLKKCQHKHLRIRKIAQKLKSWMRYSFYIRLLVEEFLLVFIVSVINVTVGGFSSWGEIFSFSFSIFMICLTLSLPFIIAFYIQRNKLTDHGRKNIGKRLGSIYLDVRKDTVGRLLYSAIYIVRRLIFCLSVIFIDTNPMLQILLFHLMSIVQFVYIGLWKPFENPLQNKIELMNESFVLIISILMPGFTDYLDDETGFTQEMLGWVVLGLLGLNCAINIVVQVKDQFQKIRVLYFRLKGCRLFTKWTRVKMMSDTQQIEGDLQQAKRGTRKFSEDTVFSTKTGLKELKMIPIDHVPTHEQQFAKGINIESLQLFTPRGRNLLDRNTPLDVISDVKILEIAEEEKEEDDNNNQIRYELGQKLERAATASQYPPRQRQNRDAHLKQLDEVSNIHNFDDFFTQFSMSPYENTKMKNKLASTMIRIRPTLDTINNQDSETLDPQLLAGYLKTENKQEKDKIYQTMHDSQMHLTTLNNNASTYLSTVPHQNALQQLMSHQSPYRDYLVGVPAEQAVDRLYEILNSRLGSSSEGSSSQSSGDSQKDSGNRFRNQSPLPEKRTKKKPPSRIKQYDDNK